jgi:hypothetical protein
VAERGVNEPERIEPTGELHVMRGPGEPLPARLMTGEFVNTTSELHV